MYINTFCTPPPNFLIFVLPGISVAHFASPGCHWTPLFVIDVSNEKHTYYEQMRHNVIVRIESAISEPVYQTAVQTIPPTILCPIQSIHTIDRRYKVA